MKGGDGWINEKKLACVSLFFPSFPLPWFIHKTLDSIDCMRACVRACRLCYAYERASQGPTLLFFFFLWRMMLAQSGLVEYLPSLEKKFGFCLLPSLVLSLLFSLFRGSAWDGIWPGTVLLCDKSIWDSIAVTLYLCLTPRTFIS